MRAPIKWLFLLLPVLAWAGCNDSTSPTTGTLRVQMTDAPGDYSAVNLVITEVSAHITGGSDSTSGWEILNSTSATYNLLTLRNGAFTTIGMASIPPGHYTQIRLKLGVGSNVVVNGVTYPLTVPSGLQTGLKLTGDFDVPAGGLVDVALDFDAARSIHQTGAGVYMLNPVVKVMALSTAGAISGTVLPTAANAYVSALQGSDTLGTTTAASDGSFKIGVLGAGTYSLAIHTTAAYRDTTRTGISVTAGNTTSIGTIQLSPQ